jgi:hypothetical protein
MKPDERAFLLAVAAMPPGEYARDVINRDGLGIHHKRCWYLLRKWARKGWYDYGVTLDLGRLTSVGMSVAADLGRLPALPP